MSNVLLAGESWISNTYHTKGWDQFHSAVYDTGHKHLLAALKTAGHDVTHMPGHAVGQDFPLDPAGLREFDVIILSDVGANTILLHPDTWLHGKRTPNRLRLLRDYVHAGGGLLMAGGYMSFQGINGVARFRGTAVEQVLPVSIHPWDDRIEEPEGLEPVVVDAAHPLVEGIQGPWPSLLGINEVEVKHDGRLVVSAGGHPLLVAGEHGTGRSLAWTSDIGPHWCPPDFLAWPGYDRLWANAIAWLAGEQ